MEAAIEVEEAEEAPAPVAVGEVPLGVGLAPAVVAEFVREVEDKAVAREPVGVVVAVPEWAEADQERLLEAVLALVVVPHRGPALRPEGVQPRRRIHPERDQADQMCLQHLLVLVELRIEHPLVPVPMLALLVTATAIG